MEPISIHVCADMEPMSIQLGDDIWRLEGNWLPPRGWWTWWEITPG
jgi:hypothetical protein